MPLLSKGMILSRIMAFEGGKNLLLKIFNFLSGLEKKVTTNYPKDEDNTPHVLSIIKKGKTIINSTANHIENIVKYVIKRVFGPVVEPKF
jgi:hypothetical protein